jgi:hypothetical protein
MLPNLNNLKEKAKEALKSVLPIVGIVCVISVLLVPVSSGIMLTFLSGSIMLILGMMLFTLGAEMAVSPMGSHVGNYLTRSRKVSVIVAIAFLLGLIITVSEPDLQVLAELVPNVPNATLILSVALGVAIFLVIAMLRMLLRIPLRILLIVSYAAVFIFAFLVPGNFLSIAFDSGGVTT